MTVLHQIENSLEMTVLHQIENSLEMTVSHQIENSLEMTVSHQIENSLEMTAPPNWGKFRNDCSTKLRKVLKMTVFNQIGKHFRNDGAPPNWE